MGTVSKPADTRDLNYLLKRAVAEVIVEEEMVRLLQSGKKIRLKEGLDPTAGKVTNPSLHFQLFRVDRGEVPIADALNPARDSDPDAYHRDHPRIPERRSSRAFF